MGFVSINKLIQISISHSGGILGRSLGKTSRNSLTMGTDSTGGISESKSSALTIWYKHPFKQEIIRPLGIEFPPSTLKLAHLEI